MIWTIKESDDQEITFMQNVSLLVVHLRIIFMF